jgi:hypothetical protein
MPNTLDHIVTTILKLKEAALRELAEADPERLKRFQFVLRNGATVFFEFTSLDSVLARIAASETRFSGQSDWNKLVLRFSGQPKLHMRFRGAEEIVDGYMPGNWEQRFGPEHLGPAVS